MVGFVVCTELWAFRKACEYGKAGAHVLVTPRLTARGSVDKWLAGGRAAAVVSGALLVSRPTARARRRTTDVGGW